MSSSDAAPGGRPASPLVVGIVLITAGVLMTLVGLGTGLISLAQAANPLVMMGPAAQAEPAREQLDEAIEAARPSLRARASLGLLQGLCSIFAVVAGIGLVMYRRWGRLLSLAWAALALPFVVGYVAVQLLVVAPATERVMQALARRHPPGGDGPAGPELMEQMGAMVTAGVAMNLVWATLLLIMPILTIVLMSRPGPRESCR